MRYLLLVGMLVSCGGSVDHPTEALRDAGMTASDASNGQPNAEASGLDERSLDAAATIDVSSAAPLDARSEVIPALVLDAPDVGYDATPTPLDSSASADATRDAGGDSLDASAGADVDRDAPSCPPGATACAGNQPIICDALGHWQINGAACSAVCITGYCEGCLVGTTRCNGLVVQTCSGGVWVNEAACAFACASGNCSGLCQPGSTRCAVEGSQVCDAIGQWQTVNGECQSTATTDASDDGG